MTPRLREQCSVQLVLDFKRKKTQTIVFFLALHVLESCMVAKKLVKCKGLQQKKGDGGR